MIYLILYNIIPIAKLDIKYYIFLIKLKNS